LPEPKPESPVPETKVRFPALRSSVRIVTQDPGLKNQDISLDPRFAALNYYPDDYQPVSLLHYLNILLRRRWLIVACSFLAAGGAYITSKSLMPVYQATALLVSNPATARSTAVAGADMGVTPVGNPVTYYSRILNSSSLNENVLNRFRSQGIQLVHQMDLPSNSSVPQEKLARNLLKGVAQISSSSNVRDDYSWMNSATVLNLTVRWRDAQLAADLANAFVEELIAYDRNIKSSTVRRKREFIEKQLQSTENLLKDAEKKLMDFKTQNRVLYAADSWGTGGGTRVSIPPELQLGKDRADREIKIQSEIYIILKRELERAKIAENNQASSLTIIEMASPPLSFSRIGSSTRRNVLLAAVVGLMLGVGLAFVLEYVANADMESADTQELLGHLASLRSDARKLLSILSLGLISAAPSPHLREKAPSD
jgi:uncharacterized protein involved in exopolysaccharide biosynthesis